MRDSFAYVGNETVGSMVEARLGALGYVRASDVGSARTVVTYCTSQTALEDAYFDEGGLVQAAAAGTLLVDLSPSTPGFARELNAVAAVSDLVAVEAPLAVVDPVRADAFSDKGNLVCFAAGDEDALAAARPVLEAVAGSVRDMGGAGAGQLARAAWTLQATAQIVSAVEADALYRAVRRSSSPFGEEALRVGAAAPLAESVLAAVDEGRFDGGYTVEMFMAELSAALTAADDADLILPQAEACLHLLELLAVIGGSDKAPSALALVYGEEAACAEQGLDWTRAESAFGEGDDEDAEDGCEEGCDADGCGCGHAHGGYRDYPDYPGYGAYSAN
ncbi:2-hydroxy-3-oxopropionate reductase [Coriobacteriaceae bacterium CHKCI002]|uniref:NAD(P)-binding domain-containing protein n=1 Tax=Rubneribacter badeniensis TaxID=2070688 RepID=A0A9D2VMR3_9ACTN|nr:6-phosphogluconate dehydrogenase [Gordonibacter sp. An232A]CVH80211.1 2-hydroxy-3-oxopropionate reductase [Coriobacteriaceae bacterium CHKCI002]HJH44489.1 NAD(P)-binding domain-containing protein [Rubneribacter badeniensis]